MAWIDGAEAIPARGLALTGLIACAVAVAEWGSFDLGDGIVTTGGATLAANAAPAGLVVTSLQTGGPAASAGLRVGDVIDRVDGHRAQSPDILTQAETDDVALLHVVARGDAGARTLLLRRHGGGPT